MYYFYTQKQQQKESTTMKTWFTSNNGIEYAKKRIKGENYTQIYAKEKSTGIWHIQFTYANPQAVECFKLNRI